MQSLREIYKIGRGPSSSHTMGPERAIKIIKQLYPKADFLKVTLYGSLALTGDGHGTQHVIVKTARPVTEKLSTCVKKYVTFLFNGEEKVLY